MIVIHKMELKNYVAVKPEVSARRHTTENTAWYKLDVDPNDPDNKFYLAVVTMPGDIKTTAIMVNDLVLAIHSYTINDILSMASVDGSEVKFPATLGYGYLDQLSMKNAVLVPAESYWDLDNMPIVIGKINNNTKGKRNESRIITQHTVKHML